MSLKTIKTTLETFLNTNVTTKVIKWNNTASYTLNSVGQTQPEIDALNVFIEPRIIPITQDRELMSTSTPRKFEVFFQIDIYTKRGTGTGEIYTTIELLDDVFVERIVTGVVVETSKTLPSFEDGDWIITPVRYLAYVWG